MEYIKNNDLSERLVSIIIPTYNCGSIIGITLESIINQSYKNWEAIIIDDCSNDSTKQVIDVYKNKDNRIKYYRLEQNSGAAAARNKGVELAKGTYIAFLDSDDTWEPNKLLKQIKFMEDNQYKFTCTYYKKIDESGNELNIVVKSMKKYKYNDLLKDCPGNSTVIYNAEKLGKFIIPDIRKRNDYVMWLKVIKESDYLYCLEEVLSSHRIRSGSISRNKFSLVKYHWYVYFNIEKLSITKSIYLIIYWIIKSIFKSKHYKKK